MLRHIFGALVIYSVYGHLDSNFDIVTDEKERAKMHKEKVIKHCDNAFSDKL